MRRGKEVLPLRIKGRLLVSDSGALVTACETGAGIAQILELGCEDLLRNGRLVPLFPDWSDERFPLHAIYPSRLHRAAKVQAFIEFSREILERRQAQFRPPSRTVRSIQVVNKGALRPP
jgi:DNA-binding transcriptional LysR family regulator